MFTLSLLSMFDKDSGAEAAPAGHRIFGQGDRGDKMYVVLEGEVRLSVNGREIERLVPGAIFGEMALIDDQPRSATAETLSPCRLVPIDARRFEFLIRQTPGFSLHVMRVMSDRLRRMDQRMLS